ncbi:MAG TPA: SDR family oxidoreductase [Candidatus Caccosoma faecigallinarum]|uniref:SDR family oxidoreductase n=1 Tax=Candidatus Caccosoma faecigallinarum TaxID=2840720 RepID=A0A9D1KB22_9FIRM|nr:SDR family oxidoreductase [Candidatus Caccosoma faecigallinarum]
MKNITIITGGSRGVGKQLAKEFLLKGENVAIISRTKSELKKTREELSKLTTNDVIAYVGDVSDEKFVKEFYEDITKKYNITCLVNNAGVGRFGTIYDNNKKMLDEVFPAIVYGTILMTTYALPHLKQSKDIVKIVNVISQSGIRAFKFESVYCSAKWAQEGYAQCLRAETFGTNIKVINVYPGGINTEFWKDNRNYVKVGVEDTLASPEEVAKIIVDNLYNKETLILKDLVFEQTHMNLE